MASLHLIIGPVGAGKSTLVHALAAARPVVTLVLDQWMAIVYADDTRPTDPRERVAWYIERVERVLRQLEDVAVQAVAAGADVVAELGLIRAAERHAVYERLSAAGVAFDVTWVDAPIDVRRARVIARNAGALATFAHEVPLPVFEMASALWEPPDDEEQATYAMAYRPTG